jgi:hypothetical protein
MFKNLCTCLGAVLILALSACSDEGDKDDGDLTWECYADSSDDTCLCYGLGPFDDLDVGGSSITPVDVCPSSPVCVTFQDDFDDPHCGCGPAGYTPSQLDSPHSIESIAACPPK